MWGQAANDRGKEIFSIKAVNKIARKRIFFSAVGFLARGNEVLTDRIDARR